MDSNSLYAILGRMAGDGAFVREMDRQIEEENANPHGLPAEEFAAMEADIRANPNRYPVLHKLLTDPGPPCTETPNCKGYVGMLFTWSLGMIIDPHYPRLVTARAARNLVAEYGNEEIVELFDNVPFKPQIDLSNVQLVSPEYRDAIYDLWPDAEFINTDRFCGSRYFFRREPRWYP